MTSYGWMGAMLVAPKHRPVGVRYRSGSGFKPWLGLGLGSGSALEEAFGFGSGSKKGFGLVLEFGTQAATRMALCD